MYSGAKHQQVGYVVYKVQNLITYVLDNVQYC